MKKLAMIALIFATPIIASSWCDDGFVGAEALYWKLCTKELRYAQFNENITTDSTDFRARDFNPNYEWGFRIFGGIADECRCNFVALEWVHINSTSSTTLGPSDSQINILPMDVPVDSVFARQKNRYNKVSLRCGHRFCGDDYASLHGYIGGRWAQILVKQLNEAKGSQNFPQLFETCTEFSGGGVEAGVGGHTDVWCGFGLGARVGIFGLVGKRAYKMRVIRGTGTDSERSNRSDHSACIGGFEVRVGVDYTYECECWWIRGEIGYETNHYLDALLFPSPRRSANNSALYADSFNFGMGGIYFGLTLGF